MHNPQTDEGAAMADDHSPSDALHTAGTHTSGASGDGMIELPVIEAGDAYREKPKQRFWRSVAQLKEDPDYKEVTQNEFRPGAEEPPSGANRRQFLQLMGASLAMGGLAACRRPVEKILPYARKPEEVIEGVAMRYATAMPFQGHLRSLLVRNSEGRPTKVEGNAEHPQGHGATSVFEQASILNMYDPDRSRRVQQDRSDSDWQAFVDFAREIQADAASRSIAVLTEPSHAPTSAALRSLLEAQYADVQWVTYDPRGYDPVRLGMQQAFGAPYLPDYRFDQAEVIVSLEADFLGATDMNSVTNNRRFADGRRLNGPEDAMSRLYVAESNYTITGAQADHRERMRSTDVRAFAAAIAAGLGVGSGGSAGNRFADHPMVDAIVQDLEAAGANGVLLAGDAQPPEVHALCAAVNDALGAIGTTMVLYDTEEDTRSSQPEALTALVDAMDAGAVDTVLMLGVNPVYDAPANLNFAEALGNVRRTVHAGLHVDETAQACAWHVPLAHYLESWGDGRSYDGTLSIVQPLIAPLYDDAHSAIEILNAFATGRDQSAYDIVRAQWRPVLSEDFERDWRRVLHNGFQPDTGYATVTPSAASVSLEDPGETDGLEVIFRLDPSVYDGRFANNAWMQELPDPTTKIVWDNVAMVSPGTAEELGLEVRYSSGNYYADVIEVSANGTSVELPVWIQPGHADGAVTVSMGYGRDIQSRRPARNTSFFDTDDYTDIYGQGQAIGTGVGTSVAPLRTTDALQVARGASVTATGQTYMIVTTMEHGAIELESRPLYRMGTYEEFQEDPEFVMDVEPYIPKGASARDYPELWDEDHPADQPAMRNNPYYKNQWGMVIDLNACTGCNACVVACQSENNIQVIGKQEVGNGREMHWLRIDRYFVSPGVEPEDVPEDPQMVLQPVPCQHCENAPCESVCPVAATVHSPDGMNQMIYNRCIGTRYCSNNCPYKVRRFNFYNWSKTLPTTTRMGLNPDVTVRSRGVMEKCSYCIQRIRGTQQRANIEDRDIRDGEMKTACQQACPAGAITFGDLNDDDSEVNRWKANPRRYEMLSEYNLKPRTSYLGRVRNPNPRLEEARRTA